MTAFKERIVASEICVKAGLDVIVREMIGAVGSAIKSIVNTGCIRNWVHAWNRLNDNLECYSDVF